MSNKLASIKKKRDEKQTGEITVSLDRLIQSWSANEQNPMPSLHVLLNQDLPIRQSFLLGKIARAVAAEIEQYQTSRKALCEKFANKDEEGKAITLDAEGKRITDGQPGRYDIPTDKTAAFEKEHRELATIDVSIPGARVKLSDLPGVRIAPVHMMVLDWLIEE